jgi:hypothetical protein
LTSFSGCSRSSPSGGISSPERCRAASSRCWRSRAAWRAGRVSCSSTSRRWASRRRSPTRSSILVEQRVVEALDSCDRGYVLETGRVALSGGKDALLGDPEVRRAYLGL